MSSNNKNAKRHIKAREISATRKSGGSGPAQTKPQHGKKNAWWQRFQSYGDYIRHATSRAAQA